MKWELAKLTPGDGGILNRQIPIREIENLVNLPGPCGFMEDFFQTFKYQVISMLLKLSNHSKGRKTSKFFLWSDCISVYQTW